VEEVEELTVQVQILLEDQEEVEVVEEQLQQ
jgi:hypothetical protein